MSEANIKHEPFRRDIVVLGASAGGLEPLQQVLGDLPGDLQASIFVVLHMGVTSHLVDILGRATALPVLAARSGMQIEPCRIYVAVPDMHLLLHDHHILLRRGPRENLARPAIDPLFRSAACSFGARVIGVVLSGSLNDGTAGLQAVKRGGGLAVVQHPSDAAVPDMPLSAVAHVKIDHVAPAAALGRLLARLVREPAGETPPIPVEIKLEAAIAAQELPGMETNEKLGKVSGFTCPECRGSLWEIDDGSLLRYRCHVGHAFTADTVLQAQTVQAEEMLWSLMRAHQERAALARRMAQQKRQQSRGALAEELLQRARGYDEDAEIIRRLLRSHMAATATSEEEKDVGNVGQDG
jgi:two-component system, chemotaxis family, protein-glutamate methylesterase/glutaminase